MNQYSAQNKDKKTGILLTNLGTPDFATKAAVKRYLTQFLSDPKVVEPPPNRFIWLLILRLFIVNIRARKSAKNYAKIWDSFGDGSPLLNISKKQLSGVEKSLQKKYDNLQFAQGMRYGKPSIASALQKLQGENCEKIIVLPLYPQYSATTTGSTFAAISAEINTWRLVPELIFIQNYHQNSVYIQALANSVKQHQQQFGAPDCLIMSYHGIPQHYVDKGDPYYKHCLQTSKLLARSLNLQKNDYQVSFQSIFGKTQWLQPYTSTILKSLAQQKAQYVQVICPGFSADCLETLEEINQENRAYFINAGGAKFNYIASLNDADSHIDTIVNILENYL